MPAIESAAEAIAERLAGGGRLVYLGAGASGLIARQDGAELSGTFGLDQSKIAFVLAGGMTDSWRLDAVAEDDVQSAENSIAALGAMDGDIVIAVSASGSTPFTLAGAKAAIHRGASLVALANQPDAPLLAPAHHSILLDSGPEALYGSTRLAAGTAQKAALGVLSTLANARLGHVYGGHMVNVRAENEKLRRRAIHIVTDLTGVNERCAVNCLASAKGDVKAAVLIASGARTREHAQALLARSHGQIGAALVSLQKEAAGS